MAIIKAGRYRLNDALTAPESESGYFEEWLDFVCNGVEHHQIWASYNESGDYVILTYIINPTRGDVEDVTGRTYAHNADGWLDEASKVITVPYDQEVGDEFAAWFAANAVAETAIIKAGTYRFHDVLTVPSEDLEQSLIFMLADGIAVCGAMKSPNPYENIVDEYYSSVSYYITESDALVQAGGTVPDWIIAHEGIVGTNGWRNEDFGVDLKTITIPDDSEVSAEFYEWFTANADAVSDEGETEEPGTTPAATVTYNGSTIASLSGGQTATLKCAGARMIGDVIVQVAENVGSGPDPVLQEKTVTENGEVVPDEGYDGLSKVTVSVPTPEGSVTIIENGTHDVGKYATAVINVSDSTLAYYDGTVTAQ